MPVIVTWFRETLENQGHSRDNVPVIAGQDWVDGRQTARLLGLRAHPPGFRKRTSTALHALASETPTAKSKAHGHTEFGEAGP